MKQSRRILAAVMAVAVVVGVAGCNKSKDVATASGTVPRAGTTAAPTTTGPPKDCVAAKETPAAAGKPTVSVPVGPPPAELVKTDLKVGDGAEAKAGDKVSVQYVGVACSTGEQFDASWDRGQPFEFTLGQGEVIKGWDEGVAGMKVGGQRQLVIPAALGYGASGQGEKIGPNETLVFVVDLVGVDGAAAAASTTAPK